MKEMTKEISRKKEMKKEKAEGTGETTESQKKKKNFL